MSQAPIREYDAKMLFARYSTTPYPGILIERESDLSRIRWGESHVIKPDQLFGKRGKYGLVWVNLDETWVKKWWKEKNDSIVTIGKNEGKLTTFLVEPFISHGAEYYIAIKTERTYDEIFFSESGGIDVEENWESVRSIKIPATRDRTISDTLFDDLKISDSQIWDFVKELYHFFVEYGFSYLEVNPFTQDPNGDIVCLDMVARVDTTESYKQRKNWEWITFTNPFWVEKSEAESYIESLDAATGASLKFRVLNGDGALWLLTSGGGASVIIADSIADMWLATEVGNYWECSGNPSRDDTRAYTLTLLDTMLRSTAKKKYLIIAWAIANFTHIDKTFGGIIDAFEQKIEEMKKQDITILVRRGGINDTKWLALMKDACDRLSLPCEIADGQVYMTDILQNITL
jgi:ATP-citrate lyase beta-subunit